MKTSDFEITLIPLDDERASWDVQAAFEEFEAHLQSDGVLLLARPHIIPPGYVAGPSDLLSGEFLLKLIPAVGPIVGAATGAWLHARYGRKIRLKVGEVEAEAQTVDEVERLIARAQDIQRNSEPKKIHEP